MPTKQTNSECVTIRLPEGTGAKLRAVTGQHVSTYIRALILHIIKKAEAERQSRLLESNQHET